MKPSSRWLLGFGVAIGVLVIVAIVLVLTMAGEAPLLPEDTPEGTVQRYIQAFEAEDYLKAYSYLSFPTGKIIPYEEWRGQIYRPEERPGVKVTLGKSAVMGSEATVDVVVDIFRPGGPFENPVDTHQTTFFLKKEGTLWKITSPTYVWWFY